MAYQPKILAFAGSLRKESFNKKLVKIAIKGAQSEGANVTYIDFKDYPLPVYDQDEEESNGLPDNVNRLKELMIQHDAFLIASPEYNSSIPGAFKNVIDWVSRPRPNEVYLNCFIDKAVLLMSASPSYLGGLRSLVHVRAIFNNVNSIVLPNQKCISYAENAFDDEGNLKDSKHQTEVMELGKKLAQFVRKIKGS